MGWSAKKLKELQSQKARKPAEQWSAGDRIGKLCEAHLRDAIVRARLGQPVDAELHVEVLEHLDQILGLAQELEGDSTMVVEEIVDALKQIDEQRNEAVEEKEEAKKELEEERAQSKSQRDDLEKDHAEDMAAVSKELGDMRRRAELAEHNLAEGTRHGHALDADAGEKIAALERQVAELRSNTELALERRKAAERELAEHKRASDFAIDVARSKLEKINAAAGPDATVEKIVAALSGHRELALKATAADEWKRSALEWRKRSEELESALAHARAINPMRRRKAKR